MIAKHEFSEMKIDIKDTAKMLQSKGRKYALSLFYEMEWGIAIQEPLKVLLVEYSNETNYSKIGVI